MEVRHFLLDAARSLDIPDTENPLTSNRVAHLLVPCQVLLLTFDRANRERAIKEGLQAMTLTAFVEKHKPDALDLLAVPEDSGCVAARDASPSEQGTKYLAR